jgi:hypothetical protein
VEANVTISTHWPGEDSPPLPTDANGAPLPFAYIDFRVSRGFLAGFGGGLGRNLYRHEDCDLFLWVAVPKGRGMKYATDLAETIAPFFRSYRDADILCTDATVMPAEDGANLQPPGVQSSVDLYYVAAVAVTVQFDLVG